MKKIGNGKIRDIYDLEDGRLVLVTSDRISAFDVIMANVVPQKGVLLNKLSAFWFDFTKELIPNHMISVNNADMPEMFRVAELDGRCMLVRKLEMLPVECIVRGYITGSGWESYQKSGSVCGIQLPKGLRESEKLPTPIYTPTTKATEGPDEHISFQQTVDLIGADLASQIRYTSIDLYVMCAEYALSRGIIIADAKFEFGIDSTGTLVLADELLTPDSSRFWPAEGYTVGQPQTSYDKQYLRDYLKNTGWGNTLPAPTIPANVISVTREKYIKAYETLTGTKF